MAKYEEELHYWLGQNEIWERLEEKTVLLSGASGTVGRCLTEMFLLRGKIRVIAVSRNKQAAKERLGKYWDSSFFGFCPVTSMSRYRNVGM